MAKEEDIKMEDADGDDGLPKGQDITMEEELDEQYPNRPHNHSQTLPFHELYLTLFNPLNDNKKKPSGPTIARRKVGPDGPTSQNPHQMREKIVDRFISRWRQEVGNDIYPAFRLIVPEKDRERPMYGLKESVIGKILVDIMKLSKDSEDADNLKHWKQPGHTSASRMAGDFAGRCYEVLSKRPMRSEPGNLTIGEVNDRLDQLAAANKQQEQTKILSSFYQEMNPEELMWLIRIILRQMKVGASEKTIFSIWHPDADSLFSISSNLRRVCWELHDPRIRLEGENRGVCLMQIFQPQLAQFQMKSFQKMVDKMRPTEDDPVFWIEEKLDGERMQLHMVTDGDVPGGKRFAYWSRKAKEYTNLYGNGFEGENGLTRFLKDAFDEGVDNIILDGEMITWDVDEKMMLPFGTLKTAANNTIRNPHSSDRPLFKVFDILFLNDQVLTHYTLRDRRKALRQAVNDVPQRLEVHSYTEAQGVSEIEPMLRKVVAEASEGLVLKNPRSPYRLNSRNDDWMKVKPEYMTEFGENLDCVIIGGYFGSGHRGGKLSSFLCGLRVDENHIAQGADPEKCYSFFKVGGGFSSGDLEAIRHKTDGKWKKWEARRPPTQYIALAFEGNRFLEQPDEWIKPSESLVVEVKAASVNSSDSFKMGYTLRFPRFKRIRDDRTWKDALSISGFMALKADVENEKKEKEFQVDEGRRKRQRTSRKKPLTIAGSETVPEGTFATTATKLFEGMTFFVMSSEAKPGKRSKAELEQIIKASGGAIIQTSSRPGVVCIGDRDTVHVTAAMKRKDTDIVRPSWVIDNVKQSEADGERPRLLLPFEPRHFFFCVKEETQDMAESNVDEYGDSYARDCTVDELKATFAAMPNKFDHDLDLLGFRDELEEHNLALGELPGWVFNGVLLYVDQHMSNGSTPSHANGMDLRMRQACNTAGFAGANISDKLVEGVTHVLIGDDQSRVRNLRDRVSQFGGRIPRLVKIDWIEQSWEEKTLLDEERKDPNPLSLGRSL